SALWGKRLELLHELVPNAAVIGMLVNPNFPDAESQAKDVKEAARIIGQQVHIVNAGSESDIDSAFGHPRSTAGRRTAGRLRCFLPQPPGSNCYAGGAPRVAHDLPRA